MLDGGINSFIVGVGGVAELRGVGEIASFKERGRVADRYSLKGTETKRGDPFQSRFFREYLPLGIEIFEGGRGRPSSCGTVDVG